jgi:radical SAM superfamily enzyme YgiQ (UPF0313 family)
MRVLLLTPPMTQLNTPYPATAYLSGYLRTLGLATAQADLSIELFHALFSPTGLQAWRQAAQACPTPGAASAYVREHFDTLVRLLPRVMGFLQGRDPTLAHRIASRQLLPEGPRFATLDVYAAQDGEDALAWAFGALGQHDRARHMATLLLNDVADAWREAVDPRFEFVRYGEKLAAAQSSFEPLAQALAAPPNAIDTLLHGLTLDTLARHAPQVVVLTTPFPGNVYGAFRVAQSIKSVDPSIRIALGGGYVNTELRELAEPRVFDYFDAVTLDAGERPLSALLEHWQGRRGASRLVRTFVREADTGAVRYINFQEPDVAPADCGTPTYEGLPLQRYVSLLDMLNPMHRLWSDGRWNKLTVAHGCYWKKCSFCDVSLDYISRYEALGAEQMADRIQALVDETGESGFHFVDEAAPPKALKALARELTQRGTAITWWGNIRFEKSFTPALCQELAASGCVAVTGGLEVASDRLLNLMQKGVSVAQVARVTKAFSDAGVLVHAYLMYGFPTQTVQDTVDALEYVRQLFAAGCIQSGFFHRFTCTVHSPVGLTPKAFGVTLHPQPFEGFAKNDVAFEDPTGTDHDALGVALKKALYNYMHGIGLEMDVRQWFEVRVPRTTVPKRFVETALALPR